METQKRPFASVVQAILVILLLVTMVLIGQNIAIELYQIGLILLVVATLSQIAFGNIPPESNFGRSMRLYAIIMAITIALFAVSILVAPFLVSLGR